MMKSCLISILVSLASFTTAWGQASGTQVTETASTQTLRNSKVRVEFPKGEAIDISRLTLNGKELVLSKGYNTVPWTLTYKGPQGENPVDYDAVISESWITQDKKNSTANEVVLNIENNETVFPRTATVEMLDKVITIFQYGKPDTSIGDEHSTSILAFPGAEGGGRFTTGGRGGEIYRVTTLAE